LIAHTRRRTALEVILVLLLLGFVVVAVLEHQQVNATTTPPNYIPRGGVILGPPAAPQVSVAPSTTTLPASHSLAKYIVRIHNQGPSNSCVGQTIAAIEEITEAERHARDPRYAKLWFSSGYIWNQINGGYDQAVTYQSAFATLTAQGDAPYTSFPYDGAASNDWVQPNQAARIAAYPYRASTWRTISPSDTYTMRYELDHGRPFGVAFNWYTSLAAYTSGYVTGEGGSFLFAHSTTAIGYTQYGLIMLNSWGPGFGDHGTYRLSWSFLAAMGASIIVQTPALGMPKKVIPFNVKGWNAFRAGHHKSLISYKVKGKLTPIAARWQKDHQWCKGVTGMQKWHAKQHFEQQYFSKCRATEWPKVKGAPVKFAKR
jgi:hypothetical protein